MHSFGVLEQRDRIRGPQRQCRNTVWVVNAFAQVNGFVHRIVMVGELTGYRDHLHIGNAVFAQHALGNILSGESAFNGDLRILIELDLKRRWRSCQSRRREFRLYMLYQLNVRFKFKVQGFKVQGFRRGGFKVIHLTNVMWFISTLAHQHTSTLVKQFLVWNVLLSASSIFNTSSCADSSSCGPSYWSGTFQQIIIWYWRHYRFLTRSESCSYFGPGGLRLNKAVVGPSGQ